MDKDQIKIIAIFATIFLVLCGGFYLTQGRKNIKQANLKKQIQKEQALNKEEDEDQDISISSSYEQSSNTKKMRDCYTFHIAGEVKFPGVYSLDKKSRVVDAINTAGGATENADLDRINLAEYIKDAEKIRVPNINERTASNSNKDSFSMSQNFGYNSDGNSIENIISSSVKPNNNYNLSANIANNNETESSDNNNNNSSASEKKISSNLININTADIKELQKLTGIGPATAGNIISYRDKNGNFNSIEDLKAVPRIGDKTFDKLRDSITVD